MAGRMVGVMLLILNGVVALVPLARRTSTPTMGFGLGRFRRKQKVPELPPVIAVGQTLPSADVEDVSTAAALLAETEDEETTPLESVAVSTSDLFGPESGKAVLFGLPGAFTPTCSDVHVPGYMKLASKFKELGVNTIACTSSNDRFVMSAWNETLATCVGMPNTDVKFLADMDADLAGKLGLREDLGFGLGIRTQRFALLLDNGVVQHVATDPGLDVCEATSAESMLRVLAPDIELDTGDGAAAIAGIGLAVVAAAAFYFMSHSGGGGGGVTVTPDVAAGAASAAKGGSRLLDLL